MRVVLGLGSNLGSRWALLQAAMDTIDARFGQTHRSSVYRSEAMTWNDAPPGPDFLNAALSFDCDLSLEDLLEVTQAIEDRFGRQRELRWGSRTLDIDILWAPMSNDAPRVPHPGLEERAFALAPAMEVAPELATLSRRLQRLGGAPPRVEAPTILADETSVEVSGCLDEEDALALAWGATAQSSGDGDWQPAHPETPLGAAHACVCVGPHYLIRRAANGSPWELVHLDETSAVLRRV